jgi:hypothetical protein
MAFITVSDAAGRVLFRRRATEAEIAEAIRLAHDATAGAEAAMREIAAHRHEALAEGAIARPLGLEWSEKPAEEGPEESVLFDDDGLRGDDWFSDVRFVDGEEEGAVS